jgi:hypothetical protein
MEVVQVAAQTWLSVAYTTDETSVADQAAAALALVFAGASELGAVVNGPPMTQFSDRAGPNFIAESGLPIFEPVETALFPRLESAGQCKIKGFGPLTQQVMPATRAIKTMHTGEHEKLAVAHRTLRSWTRDNEFVMTGGPWEVYLTDPLMAADTKQLETELYQPVS